MNTVLRFLAVRNVARSSTVFDSSARCEEQATVDFCRPWLLINFQATHCTDSRYFWWSLTRTKVCWQWSHQPSAFIWSSVRQSLNQLTWWSISSKLLALDHGPWHPIHQVASHSMIPSSATDVRGQRIQRRWHRDPPVAVAAGPAMSQLETTHSIRDHHNSSRTHMSLTSNNHH